MKRLFLIIVVATLAYAGYWFYAARDFRAGIEGWFEDKRADGWTAQYGDISVRGFPNRTDVTLTDVVLRHPNGEVGWTAPFFQILGLSYKSGHVIVAWPDQQTVTTANGSIDVSSDGLRASVIYDEDEIQRANVEATTLTLTGEDQTVAVAGLTTALEKIEPATAEYRVAMMVDALAISDPALSGTQVPDSFATLRTDSMIALASSLTLDNATTNTPKLEAIEMRRTQINYGALTLSLNGDAQFDAQGRATGEVTFAADNWREALETAARNGSLPPELSRGLVDILSLIATLNGGRDALDVTLGLNRGTVLLGPLPVGQLPPLAWP